ncbi:MAG TPA: hypothetical protein VJP77_07990 [Planctomycetota bacterium]|nr:hypothetical protein [Planctomycetota bacterium]
MTPKNRIATLFHGALAAALLSACTSEEQVPVETGQPAAVPTVEEAAAILETVPPTEAEAQAAAAETITPENEDAEFEKLREEIESDGG